MSDLSSVLPTFAPSTAAASHLLTALESLPLTTADLLSLDALDISRRLGSTSRSSVLDIKRLATAIATALHTTLTPLPPPTPAFITTGDPALNTLLNGGIPTHHITELVGESGAGKSQFLLTLTLTVQLPQHLGGLGRPAVYISTEAPLSTKRLFQLAAALSERSPEAPPSTDRVFSITCNDLETQDHIIRYQLPVMVEKHNVGLVVVDSIAANFRAEFERPVNKRLKTEGGGSTPVESGPAQMARRGKELVRLAGTLRGLAVRYGVAVVVANQVSDRFAGRVVAGGGGGAGGGGEGGDAMGLDFQSRWFSGWGGEGEEEDAKVPALGLVWANLLSARVVLRKEVDEEGDWRRRIKVVFAPWAKSGVEMGFEIVEGGVRAVDG